MKTKHQKKIGIIATRVGGLDGVSLEIDKWVKVLKKMGYKVYLCAGELQGNPFGFSQITGKHYSELIDTTIIPSLSIGDSLNRHLEKFTFYDRDVSLKHLREEINQLAERIEAGIIRWLREHGINKIIIQNINSLPAHIPAAVAIDKVLEEHPNIFALFHHHDFYWERDYYLKKNKKVKFYLEKYFPPKRKNATHITINSVAKKKLLKKCGIKSTVIPNIFNHFLAKRDAYNKNLKKDIGLEEDDIMFLAPVRIVPRKNIETAIKLTKIFKNPKVKLIIAGCVDYRTASASYFKKLRKMAAPIEDQIKFICHYIGPRRLIIDHKKIYTMWDVYAYADFVIYPTLYEGWGNALGEAITSKIPVMVNRYKIFKEDIEPMGFHLVKINNGKIKHETVEEIKEILNSPNLRKEILEENYRLIEKHCGYAILEEKLKKLLK